MSMANSEASSSLQEPLLPDPWVVRERHVETQDVVSLVLEPAAGGSGLRARPGQFNMLYVFGVGEVPISLSGAGGDVIVTNRVENALGQVYGSFACRVRQQQNELLAANSGDHVGVADGPADRFDRVRLRPALKGRPRRPSTSTPGRHRRRESA